MPIHPAVLFEDAHCLAIAKPAGVLTQGLAGGEPTVEEAVRRHLCPDDPSSAYLGTVHRLDRAVSGVLLWAKTPKAARRLADQFARRAVLKRYWAVVEGRLEDYEGLWDDWLGTVDPATGRAAIEAGALAGARRAVTRYRRLDATQIQVPQGCTALLLEPETGRTHQLRAQAAARGLPIVGDHAYGATRAYPVGIALHARSLTVEHPATRTPITFEAPFPESWEPWGGTAG